MANLTSVIALAQAAALIRGPSAGKAGYDSAAALRILDDKATLVVGVTATTDVVRFGMIPAGSKIIPNLTQLTSDHGTLAAGKIYLTPLDGSAASAGIACALNAEASEIAPMLENADCPAVTKDCWVDWKPDANLTIASTNKSAWLRLVYAALS